MGTFPIQLSPRQPLLTPRGAGQGLQAAAALPLPAIRRGRLRLHGWKPPPDPRFEAEDVLSSSLLRLGNYE